MHTSPFCENCGAANDRQTTTCHFCGHALHEEKQVLSDGVTGSLGENIVLKERYRIGVPIGQGGMGTVYRAHDLELNNRLVAIKEMIVSRLSTKEAEEATEAFKREAELLAVLQHPNLPGIFDHFEENGRWYLVMSFIQGETLENYLERNKQGRLSLNEVLQIGQQLCTVLHYLHSQHPPIIFRDLKPSNIMRTPDGQIYLIDFGVARHFKLGQKKDTVPFGSMGYAPPEQFGKSQTTPRSDIYSLGATLHQLLSGHDPDSTPFRFPSLTTLVPGIPAKLAMLIAQMLEMNEEKRPENLLMVKQKLQGVTDVTTSSQPFSSFLISQRAPLVQRRSARTVALIFLALCCILVGVFTGFEMNIGGNNQVNQTTITDATITVQAGVDATQGAEFTGTATGIAKVITAMPDPQSGALPAPMQISPASGTVFHQYPRTLTLVWNAVPGAVSYTVLVNYYDPNNTSCTNGTPYTLATDLTSTAYTFDFSGEQPGCWQVWAVNTTGNGHKSPLWEFSFTQ